MYHYLLLYDALTFPLSLSFLIFRCCFFQQLTYSVPCCSKSPCAQVWLTSFNMLWPKTNQTKPRLDFMEYKKISHYTLRKDLRVLPVGEKKVWFYWMHRLWDVNFDYTYHSHPSNPWAYVWWGKGKMGPLWREDIAFLSWYHDCTLEVETTRYLEKVYGFVIICKIILFFRWLFSL